MTDSTQKSPSNSDNPQFTRTPKKPSMTDFSDNPEVNIGNIFGELSSAKFRNSIATGLGSDLKVMV